MTAPFVLAVALLLAAAVMAGPVADWLHIKMAKQALDLRMPLARLDEGALGGYRLLGRRVLSPEVIDALGTEHYISWTLEDQDLPSGDPRKIANLLITYYTGQHSLVPHTPDVCYLGSGYAPSQAHENVELPISIPGQSSSGVPVRVCTFGRTAIFGREQVTVIYTFSCNGKFLVNSRRVRARLHNPSNTYAYHSKVEVSFPHASREQSLEGARKLFSRLLPELMRRHWPDFEADERLARKGVGTADE